MLSSYFFNGLPVDARGAFYEGSISHAMREIFTKLWSENVGFVVISSSFNGVSGPSYIIDFMSYLGVWKHDDGRSFNSKKDDIKNLCLLGRGNKRG